jgi:hypothetical protein
LTSPRESGIINAKIANGDVKTNGRFPARVKKAAVFQPPEEAPVHKAVDENLDKNADKKADKKEHKNSKPEKPKRKSKPELTFPATIKINHYGFVNLRKQLLEALGWTKDMALVVVKNPDGSVTVRKA